MMHPIATKASYLFKFLDIATGISNDPGTLIILINLIFLLLKNS